MELLLVLVILGVLATIVATRFTGTTGKAKITAAKTQMSNIKGALTSYEIELGSFPTTQQGLEALTEMPSGVDEAQWRRFLDEKVENDPWGNAWVYRFPGTHNNDYDLYSAGPDSIEGNDDDIKNWSDDD